MDTRIRNNRNSGAYVGAVILIVIGVAALTANLGGGDLVYQSIPLGIGLAFAVAYAFTRQYGFLVPAGILTGVGAGLVASNLFSIPDSGTYVLIGGGLGFILIFAIDLLVSSTTSRWWPVIPGGLMLVIGAEATPAHDAFVRGLQLGSPVLLIVIGLLILFMRSRRSAGS